MPSKKVLNKSCKELSELPLLEETDELTGQNRGSRKIIKILSLM